MVSMASVGTALKESFAANAAVYYILAASIVELIAAGVLCEKCDSYVAWAVAVGAISTFFTFVHAIICTFKPSLAAKIAPFLSTFLVLWWIPGAGIPTFKSPFVVVGNGYFSCWVAFLASLVFFQHNGLALMSGASGSEAHEAQGQQQGSSQV
ncbi:hypothetical protein CHLRE_10g425850v5 [Chlamydomonas reinhardtii]|uniref:Uncharacterized protein n=1 Tax=Chlamydomonas reinhardtii TaxID=3055 RepID=A8IC56_CHLRE|nr:uncharacterized protein CHLRE_10g425850v5 [Chlamydomonas reinhardtii]PNW77184.1 hypothetical protein CHLRE_10g425850v5 [Chlamydomonas reinhardtii]|eukprot:XP_001702731.1 predicted protein [Chlamydomonas reinhardtii]